MLQIFYYGGERMTLMQLLSIPLLILSLVYALTTGSRLALVYAVLLALAMWAF
jgi:hypothetical protein